MELKRVSEQPDESLADYFGRVGMPEMVELIQAIQDEVDGPAHFATTSTFHFYLSAVDDWEPLRARVFVYATASGFTIKYRSRAEFVDWDEGSFTTIQVAGIAGACLVLEHALRVAIADPQGRPG